MIKQGIKNYFKNLKYFFNPLGAIALGFVFGLSVLIPVVISSVNGLFEQVKTIFANTNLDYNALKDSFYIAVKALNWSEPLQAIQIMLSKDWLLKTFEICLSSWGH